MQTQKEYIFVPVGVKQRTRTWSGIEALPPKMLKQGSLNPNCFTIQDINHKIGCGSLKPIPVECTVSHLEVSVAEII